MTQDHPSETSQNRRVTVTHGRHGWEVMEMRDNQVVRRANYTDWHRVERAVQVFDLRSDLGEDSRDS